MARTTSEILEDLQAEWMNSPSMQNLYGFAPNTPWVQVYSKVSIEGIILYIVAYCAHVLEALFESTKEEVEERFLQQLPGTTRWYAQKLKDYHHSTAQVRFDLDEWGNYILDTHTPDEISQAQIIKHAVAIDDTVSGILLLKIAGESNGNRIPLTDQQTQIEQYILRIKYAGVKTRLINEVGDEFNCTVDIWYDPLLQANAVKTDCEAAMKAYLQNLPFNGEFSIMALTDSLQAVKGVKIVQVRNDLPNGTGCYAVDALGNNYSIADKATPYAGYFNPGTLTTNMIPY